MTMTFDQGIHKDLRDLFCNAVTKVFGDSEAFLDFLENEKYSNAKYDCYLDYSGENYIINRQTGEYINWYKFDHIGRDIHISSTFHMHKNMPAWFEEFLTEFKESWDDIDKQEIAESVVLLDLFTKTYCRYQNDYERFDDLKFRCEECPFSRNGECLVKSFKNKYKPNYRDFGSMGDL